jgi:DNA-binding NtrC family response regulator
VELKIGILGKIDVFPPIESARIAFLRWYWCEALVAAGGNQSKAAAFAGVHRNTLSRACAELGIPKGFGRRRGVRP